MTQREIASKLGKSREVVANAMRLLDLPEYIRVAVEKGEMSESHAPGFVDGCIAAGHGRVTEMREAAEGCGVARVEVGDEDFPAPYSPIRPVAGAVEREAYDGAVDTIFCHAGGDVGVVVLNGDERQFALCGKLFGPGS